MTAYGIIGLGAMGMGMAHSLVRAGLDTYAFARRPAIAEAFSQAGGTVLASAVAVAQRADVLFSVVVDIAQMEDVFFAQGAAAALRPGAVVISCSTVKPEEITAFGERLAAMNILLIDAPISGGPAKAMNGDITIMASGADAAFAKAADGLAAVSGKLYRLGDAPGAGSAMKVVHQLLAGVHIAVGAEAMAFGIRMGLDPATVYEVVTNAAGNSWMFASRMAQVVSGDYTPQAAVDIFVKDLSFVLDSARKVTFPVPIAATALQQFMHASAAGYGREGDAAVIKIFPGITLPPKTSHNDSA